jgi:hypothetical protein
MTPENAPQILFVCDGACFPVVAGLQVAMSSTGCRVTIVRELPEHLAPGTMVICHLRSTLTHPRDISGYVEFIRRYAALRQTTWLKLLVISPRFQDGPDVMVGFGSHVDAYVTEPVEPQVLLGLLRRLIEQREGEEGWANQ